MKTTFIFIAIVIALSACSIKQEKTKQASTIDSTLQNKVASEIVFTTDYYSIFYR